MYYFASDVHLGAGGKDTARRTEARFTAWLDEAAHDAKEIWLLGDIFDFWFEYSRVVPKGFVRTLGKLAELSARGVRILLFTGNHDMWVYDYLSAECGVEIHKKPLLTELAGKKAFIAHGDNMCIDGAPMLKFLNLIFRSKVLRFLFSWLVHPDLAMRFGHWWSGKSRKSHGGVSDPAMLDPLTAYADRLGREQGVDICIFGHFHMAGDRAVNDGGTRVLFLSDWSNESVAYAAMDDSGEITLKTFTK